MAPARIALRRATPADYDTVLPRTRGLNAHEGIAHAPGVLEAALRRLLAEPALGGCWLIERPGTGVDAHTQVVGYAIATFGFDLEFGGRDAYLTELWIDDGARGHGAGMAALALLDGELRAHGVRALHLQVRPENPAVRLYERAGFVRSPRWIMTRRL